MRNSRSLTRGEAAPLRLPLHERCVDAFVVGEGPRVLIGIEGERRHGPVNDSRRRHHRRASPALPKPRGRAGAAGAGGVRHRRGESTERGANPDVAPAMVAYATQRKLPSSSSATTIHSVARAMSFLRPPVNRESLQRQTTRHQLCYFCSPEANDTPGKPPGPSHDEQCTATQCPCPSFCSPDDPTRSHRNTREVARVREDPHKGPS